MLQVEGCNQTEVPLVGPISCRMESSFCRSVLPSFLPLSFFYYYVRKLAVCGESYVECPN
jgi:hypothetical protein